MDSWKGVLPNGVTHFYLVKLYITSMHWEPVGSPATTIEDAEKERDRIMKIPQFKGARFSIWKMEQVVEVSRCGFAEGTEEKKA